MNMNEMMQFIKQIPGKLGSNKYTSVSNQMDPRNVAYLRQLQREIRKQDVMEIPFSKLNLVVFDLETSGFHPYKGDRILSVGAVKVKDGIVLDTERFYSLVYSEADVPPEIETLTGITKSELLVAPPIETVLTDFFRFIKSDPLVAHHANHERSFMQHVTWYQLKTHFEHRIIDTSFLTKIAHPKATYVTLDDWCGYYCIENKKRHHALHDALATANLWAKSVNEVQKLGFLHLKDVYTHLARFQ